MYVAHREVIISIKSLYKCNVNKRKRKKIFIDLTNNYKYIDELTIGISRDCFFFQ